MRNELLVNEVNAVRRSAACAGLTCVSEGLGRMLKTGLLKLPIGAA